MRKPANLKPRPSVEGDRSIDILREDPRNPRMVSDAALDGLGVSLRTFGDVSTITFNERTGVLVGGHQRLKKLKLDGAVTYAREPGAEFGYIEHPKTKERFTIRFVDWDETKQRLANLAANNPHIQGEFDDQALAQLRELQEVDGFDELALAELQKDLLKGAKGASKSGEGGNGESSKLTDGFMVIIECSDEAEQSTLLRRFYAEGLKCRALT